MPRKKIETLEKVTLNINRGDKDTLAAFYPKLGWSVAAREIILRHCKQLREAENAELKQAEIGDIKVPPLDA